MNFPAKPFYDVIVTGSYFCDLVFTGLPTLPQLGTEIYAPQLDLVIGGGAAILALAGLLSLAMIRATPVRQPAIEEPVAEALSA